MPKVGKIIEVVVARSTRIGFPMVMDKVFPDPVKEINKEYIERIERISKRMYSSRGAQKTNIPSIKPGQSEITTRYCSECLQRHFSKAHGLLEEAERFSIKQGTLTSEAADKIRTAVEEIVTAEDDIDTTGASPEIRSKLNDIKDRMRDIRKQMWTDNLSFEGSSLDALKIAKGGVEELVRCNYELMKADISSKSGLVVFDTRELELASGFLDMGNAAEAEKLIDEYLEREECAICVDDLKEAKLLISKGKYKAARKTVMEIVEAYREI